MNVLSKRILAFLVDLMILTFVAGVAIILIFKFIPFPESALNAVVNIWYYTTLVVFLIRDSIGVGFGKKIFKLKVMIDEKAKPDYRSDAESKGIASWRRNFLRNLPLLFWPLEVIMLLANDSRRLGDMLAHTKVVECPVQKNDE